MSVGQENRRLGATEDTETMFMDKIIAVFPGAAGIARLAKSIWIELALTNPSVEETDTALTSSVIYMASVDIRYPYGLQDPQAQATSLEAAPLTVTQLLQHTNISLRDLLEKLKWLKNHHFISDAFANHLSRLEKKYLFTCPLFAKFERMFDEIYPEDLSDRIGAGDLAAVRDQKKKLCWLLFIWAKGQLEYCAKEIVLSFHLLICCIHCVLNTTPAFKLRPPFDEAILVATEKSEFGLLQELCKHYRADFKEVLNFYKMNSCLQGPLASDEEELERLMSLYEERYKQEGDIDERQFLYHDSHLYIPNHNHRSPTRSAEVNMNGLDATPVKKALQTVQQLKDLLSVQGDEPSPALSNFFKRCIPDPTTAIKEHIASSRTLFVSQFKRTVGHAHVALANQRYDLTVRLYYLILEALLNLDGDTEHVVGDLSRLLMNMDFHKSALGCSAEVVITTYGVSSPSLQLRDTHNFAADLEFPWILRVFNIQAWEFCKILDSFIKAEPKLTKQVVQHLKHIEAHILEELAWQSDSTLYAMMATSEVTKPTVPPPSPGGPSSNTTAPTDLYQSPRPFVVPAAPLSPARRSNLRRSKSLDFFLNKVFRLCYVRLQSMCHLLEITSDVQHKIWCCFEYCIICKPELLKDRHVDQILMCSVFGIGKVLEMEIKFKTIVGVYRQLPQTSEEVFKQTRIAGNEFDTIIAFYNRVFMLNMRTYILQYSTAAKLQNSPSAKSIYSVQGRKNFFISPLKESPFRPPQSPSQLTPRTRQLYSFGDGIGSAEKLRVFNEQMRSLSAKDSPEKSSSSKKCLKFDLEDESDQRAPNSAIALKFAKSNSPQVRKCLKFSDSDDVTTNRGTENDNSKAAADIQS